MFQKIFEILSLDVSTLSILTPSNPRSLMNSEFESGQAGDFKGLVCALVGLLSRQ